MTDATYEKRLSQMIAERDIVAVSVPHRSIARRVRSGLGCDQLLPMRYCAVNVSMCRLLVRTAQYSVSLAYSVRDGK